MTTLATRLAAATAAAALALGAPALADARVVTGNDRGIAAESVDKQRPIALTVKKTATNPYDDVPAGQKPAVIEGAVFTLSRVEGIDVTTTAGREQARGMTLADAYSNGTTRTATATTGADGVARFEGLAPGLYLLEESAPDAAHNYRLSGPQLVLLPLGDVTGQRFTYDNVVVTKPTPRQTVTLTTTTTPTPGDSTSITSPTRPGDWTPPTFPGEPTPVTSTPVTPTPTGDNPGGGNGGGDNPGGGTPGGGTPGGGTPGGGTPGGGSDGGNGRTDGSDGSRNGGGLAYTGANVLWLVGIGAILIVAGIGMTRRNNGQK